MYQMNIFQRMSRGLSAGAYAFRTAPDLKAASIIIDKAIEEKQAPNKESMLDIRQTTHDLAYASLYQFVSRFNNSGDNIPAYGTQALDYYTADLWRDEPILAGAIYSMTAKMSALTWKISGKRNMAMYFAKIFANALYASGKGWGGFSDSTCVDYYTTNRGVFWETPRVGGKNGKLAGLGHVDALCCNMTGNMREPVEYWSYETGQTLRMKPEEIIHFASLISPREQHLGIGFCAVARALKAAKLLMGLHNYDTEKLNNLPPEGIASVTGLTMDEFKDALALWQVKRKQDNSLTFPQVLWLIGSQPQTEVKVNLQGFSQLPESFERQPVVTQYVNTLALCFGVDAREFWAISSGALGTASESEIQHLKAKGKGSGELITAMERQLNSELPDGVDFGYDTRDIEEDMTAAATAKAWIDAFLPLLTTEIQTPEEKKAEAESKVNPFGQNGQSGPTGASGPRLPFGQVQKEGGKTSGGSNAGFPKNPEQNLMQSINQPKLPFGGAPGGTPGAGKKLSGNGLISKQEFLRLLADKGVIPDYLVKDQGVVVEDADIHLKEEGYSDDATSYVWKNGILKEQRLAPIVIISNKVDVITDMPEPVMKTRTIDVLPERDIHGEPIKDDEVVRGARITKTTVEDELALWRDIPELQPHALTKEEEPVYIKDRKL
jgi:hypothetical protein